MVLWRHLPEGMEEVQACMEITRGTELQKMFRHLKICQLILKKAGYPGLVPQRGQWRQAADQALLVNPVTVVMLKWAQVEVAYQPLKDYSLDLSPKHPLSLVLLLQKAFEMKLSEALSC